MVAGSALFAFAEPERLGGAARSYELDIDGQRFTIEFNTGRPPFRDGPTQSADLVVAACGADFIRLRRGSLTLRQATKAAAIQYLPADRTRIAEFADVFRLDAGSAAS
jgi:hypothetical protein